MVGLHTPGEGEKGGGGGLGVFAPDSDFQEDR